MLIYENLFQRLNTYDSVIVTAHVKSFSLIWKVFGRKLLNFRMVECDTKSESAALNRLISITALQ